MVFDGVKNLGNAKDFKEKILLYIRIVEVTAQMHGKGIEVVSTATDSIVGELCAMGVVSSSEDMPLLRSVLGNDYKRMVSCVGFYLANPQMLDGLLDKLSNAKRKLIQQQSVVEKNPTVADFFAGAGGLSSGFTQAGFRVCFANDHEEVCVRTYRYNHPEVPAQKVVQEDIKKIVDNINDFIDEPVDVVVGGPPCQGFSPANQQQVIDDPRNELYKYYIEAVRRICPKFVVMENVRGMLSIADQVIENYKNIRISRDGIVYTYDVAYRLLNSVDFGVAQSRERLVYIAIRNDVANARRITPQMIFDQIQSECAGNPVYLLRDALDCIKPLEAPRTKGLTEFDDEITGMKVGVNNFDSCGNQYLYRVNGGRQFPIVFNHKARYCSDVNYEIFKRLSPGEDSTNAKIADIMPYAHRNKVFKDKYYKLYADRPCRTITAHMKMDCLSHIHPVQIRSLTPREAARVQSFPDDYVFLGAYLKTYMQIGNAVPVLMAKQIASTIRRYL